MTSTAFAAYTEIIIIQKYEYAVYRGFFLIFSSRNIKMSPVYFFIDNSGAV